MPAWIIDTQERTGQLVLTGDHPAPIGKENLRFRQVTAETVHHAIDKACFQRIALLKLQAIKEGKDAIMSDKELDWLIDEDLYPMNVVSIPNPLRMGVLDAYLVAGKAHPSVTAYADKVKAEYESRPEIQAYREALAA
jgi:hypothetical protein